MLPRAQFAYNNNIYVSTGVTKFFAENGFHPSIEATIHDVPVGRSVLDVPDAKAQAERLAEFRAAVEQRWRMVSATQQKYADRRTKPHEFQADDVVWLSGNNIRTERPSKKLEHRFYGSYSVVERIGTQAYCLELLQQAGSIQDVFHVLLLEPYVSDGHTAPKPLPHIEIDGEEQYRLEEILQSEYRYGTLRYHVKYNENSVKQSKWLPVENLAHAQDMVSKFHASHLN
jgi:hypothetical protein